MEAQESNARRRFSDDALRHLGNRIKRARVNSLPDREMLQDEMASRMESLCSVKVSRKTISDWENGRAEPSLLDCWAVATVTECPGGLEWFLPAMTQEQAAAYERARTRDRL